MTHGDTDHDRLVAALANPALHGPDCTGVTLLETHISSVLLTGRHAYKLKKPVALGFLDFSTLAARHRFCEQELRLNRRLAPELYLDVVTITGTPDAPLLGGNGPVLDYAVRMIEFAQRDLASQMLARDELMPTHIDALAGKVAVFHAAIAGAAPPAACGTPEAILGVALANIDHLRPCLATAAGQTALLELETWTRREHAALSDVWRARRLNGFVRECHGDLHLGNIAVLEGDPVIFDCIEFNDAMRWIDVMSEIAFTVMDLQARGHAGLAHRFLNAYLECTGDYAGLRVLRFYLVYRALVRAKVLQLRAGQMPPGTDNAALQAERDAYVHVAQNHARPPAPAIAITHGLSGCGKTTLTGILLERTGAVRIRTDVERKRDFGIGSARHVAGVESDRMYSPEATRQTYEHVQQLARAVVTAGFVVIIDGTFLQRRYRDRFRALAAELAVPFVVIAFEAEESTLRARLVERRARGNDASDADLAVLDQQLRLRQAFDPDEAAGIVTYDAGRPLAAARSEEAWHAVLARLAREPQRSR
jgi:uncharacterized protein